MDFEQTVMELLINAGEARSHAMSAIQLARKRQWQEADAALAASAEASKAAHHIQTQLIGADEGEGKLRVTLIPCMPGSSDERHAVPGSGGRDRVAAQRAAGLTYSEAAPSLSQAGKRCGIYSQTLRGRAGRRAILMLHLQRQQLRIVC